MLDRSLIPLAEELISLCIQRNSRIVTAESCTGGMISAALTAIAGASRVMDGGFVTYSNEAKQAILGVSNDMITRLGAVSEEVAGAMAEGALALSDQRATHAISVTGIAGPDGGSTAKPVGFVCFGLAIRDSGLMGREISGGQNDQRRIDWCQSNGRQSNVSERNGSQSNGSQKNSGASDEAQVEGVQIKTCQKIFENKGRDFIRLQSAIFALTLLKTALS